MEPAVRWNIRVSKEVDLTLRAYLGARAMKKGDLSKFIEDAVRWRLFNRTVQEIKSRNVDADRDELQAIIDGPSVKPAPKGARKERRTRPDANVWLGRRRPPAQTVREVLLFW